ncbi:MAG: dephospho-CoA kinase [Pedosphaera sp.]|nr:dephospho-CoA kinase [Pedosphaera sp.]
MLEVTSSAFFIVISIGMTGGIGAGKSVSAEFLHHLGIPLLDTDSVARELVRPGETGYLAVYKSFGPSFFLADGTLDRPKMAALVFADPQALHRLEAILHPLIRAAWEAWIHKCRERREPMLCVVIPLLFERGYRADFPVTIAVSCSVSTQLERLRCRGWTDLEIQRRLAAQQAMSKKAEQSRFVVWNEGTVTTLKDQWIKILATLKTD